MKVLMTADTVGGVWAYALELIAALAPHGVEVTLCTMGAPVTAGQRREAAALTNLTLYDSAFRLEWMEEPWPDVYRAGDWLLRLEEDLRPDVVHLNCLSLGALPWRAPVLVVGHSCVLSWWRAVRGEDAPPAWDRYRYEVAQGLRGADLVLAPSRAMLAALERHYGPLARTGVVHNGVAAGPFAPRAKDPFILSAGRLWDDAKNLRALDAVAPRLDWPVYVAGDTTFGTTGDPSAGEIVPANVLCLGRLGRRHLANWYARAAIYALPARYEPFGLTALEAGLAGCALVLGAIDSLSEIWGDAAILVPPDDHDALEERLKALVADPAARGAWGRRARARALEYTPDRMARGYLNAYRALAEGGRRVREAVATAVRGE
mgnify:CR=1 FL=1